MRRGLLVLACAGLLGLACGTGRAAADPPAVAVEVIGGPRPEALDRVIGVLQDIGLPLPANTRVYIYSSRQAFRKGIVEDAHLSPDGADELASFAVGLARPGRVLLNGRLSDSGSEWVRLLAHELTHVAQFRLAGGEGRADQWLAEGVAEHVAFQTLERMASDRSSASARSPCGGRAGRRRWRSLASISPPWVRRGSSRCGISAKARRRPII